MWWIFWAILWSEGRCCLGYQFLFFIWWSPLLFRFLPGCAWRLAKIRNCSLELWRELPFFIIQASVNQCRVLSSEDLFSAEVNTCRMLVRQWSIVFEGISSCLRTFLPSQGDLDPLMDLTGTFGQDIDFFLSLKFMRDLFIFCCR